MAFNHPFEKSTLILDRNDLLGKKRREKVYCEVDRTLTSFCKPILHFQRRSSSILHLLVIPSKAKKLCYLPKTLAHANNIICDNPDYSFVVLAVSVSIL